MMKLYVVPQSHEETQCISVSNLHLWNKCYFDAIQEMSLWLDKHLLTIKPK